MGTSCYLLFGLPDHPVFFLLDSQILRRYVYQPLIKQHNNDECMFKLRRQLNKVFNYRPSKTDCMYRYTSLVTLLDSY